MKSRSLAWEKVGGTDRASWEKTRKRAPRLIPANVIVLLRLRPDFFPVLARSGLPLCLPWRHVPQFRWSDLQVTPAWRQVTVPLERYWALIQVMDTISSRERKSNTFDNSAQFTSPNRHACLTIIWKFPTLHALSLVCCNNTRLEKGVPCTRTCVVCFFIYGQVYVLYLTSLLEDFATADRTIF